MPGGADHLHTFLETRPGILVRAYLNALSSVRHSSRSRVRDLHAWGLKGVAHADW